MRTSVGQMLLERLFIVGNIREAEQITPCMKRIRIEAEGLTGVSWTPGQHIRLLVKDVLSARTWLDGSITDALRTYSVWNLDRDEGVMDLVGYDHGGDSPGVTLIRNARVGQEIAFTKPEGNFVVRHGAPYHLFAGEETASVAFGAMLRSLAPAERVFGVVEADNPGDHLEMPRELVRAFRRGLPAANSETLLKAVMDLDLPDEPGVAYLAGEARTIQAIRAHLVNDRGWQRRDVRTKPFWTPGKRGLD